jgi:uncharacterized protein (DUF58 family)
MSDAPSHALTWRPSAHARRMATVALFGLLAAALTGRAQMLLVAVPLLAALAAERSARRPASIAVRAGVRPRRCFEGEEIELAVTCPDPPDAVGIRLDPPGAMTVVSGAPRQGHTARWTLRAERWGHHRLEPLTVDVRSGSWQARLHLSAGEITVFPRRLPVRPRLVPADLPERIGEHVSRTAGSGVEFAGIRPYAAGDRLRDVNWKASGHRGRLHVTTRAAERQADIVLVIDARTDLGPPTGSTLDASMRAAAGLAGAYLHRGDRVGVVALGGHLTWLAPGIGDRYFYRIAEAVLDVRRYHSEVPPDLGRIPRVALPPAALAIAFSPLLDDHAIAALIDLRRRGNPVVVIDVLDREPPSRSPDADLALRLWRLDRTALIARLADLGITVIGWPPGEPLDAALQAAPRR